MKNTKNTLRRSILTLGLAYGLILSQVMVTDAYATAATSWCHIVNWNFGTGAGSDAGKLPGQPACGAGVAPLSSVTAGTGPNGWNMPAGLNGGQACPTTTQGTWSSSTPGNGNAIYAYACATPEMSDYLAMSFVLIAGGMIYRLRRRAVSA